MECPITDDPFPAYVIGDLVCNSFFFQVTAREKHFTLLFMSREHADDARDRITIFLMNLTYREIPPEKNSSGRFLTTAERTRRHRSQNVLRQNQPTCKDSGFRSFEIARQDRQIVSLLPKTQESDAVSRLSREVWSIANSDFVEMAREHPHSLGDERKIPSAETKSHGR